MPFSENYLDRRVEEIVLDAIAETASVQRSTISPETTLEELGFDSLDGQDWRMEIEEQCDDLPELDQLPGQFLIPKELDNELHKARTIRDVTHITLRAIYQVLGHTEKEEAVPKLRHRWY
jgi:acyl carrier protein